MWFLLVSGFCFGLVRAETTHDLTLLHINDIHARFEETDKFGGSCPHNAENCYGGLSRIHQKVLDIKKEKTAIFVNAGDFYQVKDMHLGFY